MTAAMSHVLRMLAESAPALLTGLWAAWRCLVASMPVPAMSACLQLVRSCSLDSGYHA